MPTPGIRGVCLSSSVGTEICVTEDEWRDGIARVRLE